MPATSTALINAPEGSTKGVGVLQVKSKKLPQNRKRVRFCRHLCLLRHRLFHNRTGTVAADHQVVYRRIKLSPGVLGHHSTRVRLHVNALRTEVQPELHMRVAVLLIDPVEQGRGHKGLVHSQSVRTAKAGDGSRVEYLIRDPGMRGVAHVGDLGRRPPARESLRVLDRLGGVLGHELGEPGDRSEGGEAAAADSDGVGPVAAADSRVLARLEDVYLGEGRVVAGEQLGREEEAHRPRPDDREPGRVDGPAVDGEDQQRE